ncbi:MAG: cyclase family protein [Bacteroidota bacterium]
MSIQIFLDNRWYKINGQNPIDLSLSTGTNGQNPNAFFINPAQFEPIRVGGFVGSVHEGGSANCEVLTLCAHGNGTHTECVGHISENRISLPDVWQDGFHLAQLVTIDVEEKGYISLEQVMAVHWHEGISAVVFRSLPNDAWKMSFNWSGNNAPYFQSSALEFLLNKGILHLLTDFPSVDPEEDNGQLEAHHAWWGVPYRSKGVFKQQVSVHDPRSKATITELIYVPNDLVDGSYVLQIQIPHFMTDAVPSRPLLYPILD